jgi:hypothetical protein
MDFNEDDRLLRWQGYSIAQLSIVISVFLLLAIGGLNYQLQLAKDLNLNAQGRVVSLSVFSLVGFLISIGAGLGALISRTLDFRLTAEKCRRKSESAGIEKLWMTPHDYGKLTWRLVWLMLSSFLFASVFMGMVVLKTALSGLFSVAAGMIIAALSGGVIIFVLVIFPGALVGLGEKLKISSKQKTEAYFVVLVFSWIVYKLFSKYLIKV